MRTPEEILNEAIVRNSGNENWSFKEEALEAIRQAQIEAIEECAKVATVQQLSVKSGRNTLRTIVVDKSSILQLKNQVK